MSVPPPDIPAHLAAALADRYRIERAIGEGGMATVYLAHDLKHDRQVAIKVLKPELGAVLGAERFLSEIKLTANLQHPNLLPLFDSGDADGTLYYVMPFVEGESLRARLDREKQLPIDEAVRISTAVASALAYAHERGVIHRDLKPENILLQSGQPVVADFGIALAVSNAGGTRVTQTGLSLGTPQYMSPEQATGDRAIDARSDIYSLAALTYEMIGGEPPHSGSTAQAIIAKLMTAEPQPLSDLRRSAPMHVEAALARGLAKLPADRFATATEFGEALSGVRPVTMIGHGTGAGGRGARARRTSVARRIAEGAVAVVAVLGVAGTAYFATRSAPAPMLTRFNADMPDSMLVAGGATSTIPGGAMALSADGRELVVSGNGRQHGPDNARLYLRRMDDTTMVVLPGTERAWGPAFSPDGQWVLFANDAGLMKLAVSGGAPLRLASATHQRGASWGDDGNIVYAQDDDLWSVSSDGGVPRQVSHGRRLMEPEVLPGAHDVLAVGVRDGDPLVLVSLSDGRVTDLGVSGYAPHYVSSGHIVFYRGDGTVYAVPFSPRKHAVTGDPVPIVTGVANHGPPFPVLAVSRDRGVLAYVPGSSKDRGFGMFAVSRTGVEQQLAPAPDNFRGPRLSADALHAVVRIGPPAFGGDLWVYELNTGARVRLTTNGASRRPEWIPGTQRIAFLSVRGSATSDSSESIVSRPWDLSASETTLVAQPPKGGGALQEVSFGAPHTWAAFRLGSRTAGQSANIWIAPSDSLSGLRPFLTGNANRMEPRVSHDGRMLAYTSEESGDNEVYVTPLPGPGPHVAVSVEGGREPVWSRDDKTLFYRNASYIMAATIEEGPRPRVMRRDSLFADIYQGYLGYPSYDVFPDGRLLMVRPTDQQKGSASSVTVVMHWQQLLKRQ